MSEHLKDFAIAHAAVQRVRHDRLKTEVTGHAAVRYLRFMRPVRIERLELPHCTYGRWVPNVLCHPAHLLVQTLDTRARRWRTVREVEFPSDPRVAGKGLSQAMSIEEMNTHFGALLKEPPRVIELGGLETDHLRVVCDREHPVWPNHGECNGGGQNVPFGILEFLRAVGAPLRGEIARMPYQPILRNVGFQPKAPRGMTVEQRPDMLLFSGRRLSIGFCLARPMLMHLGWDAVGGEADRNRLLAARVHSAGGDPGLSGPVLRTINLECRPQNWSGEVCVSGNRVAYRNLRTYAGVRIEAVFTVEPNRILLDLTQECARPLPALEAEAWRLTWDQRRGITGAAALPTLLPGRNGDVNLPFLWASDRVGALACRRIEGEDSTARVQVESARKQNVVTGGFVLAPRPEPEGILTLPKGRTRAVFELAVAQIEPLASSSARKPGVGLRRHWGTVFSCFRPEHRGFSNNAASTNCHVSQGAPVDMATVTRRPKDGPDPVALARFTVERGILDGGGYGYWRNLYLDSDPVLVAAAGRIHQARPSREWLRRIEPGLFDAVERMTASIGSEGLAVCRDLSGNARSWRWSTNAMDVVGFGHIDGYVNALSYRAFRNAAALLADLGRVEESRRCRDLAAGIRANYARQLLNPKTGWVAGWRSRDGELHDYAFTWVNGVACAFGVLEPSVARRALTRLETLRRKVGPPSARLGLPCNLLPIREEDHMLPKVLGHNLPTFETYTDGSLSGWPATYYLRALSIHGLRTEARGLAAELAEGYAAGIFNGGIGGGQEFRSWDGVPTGYEGTLIGCFGPLYGIAIEEGVLTPPDPEWWPAGG